MARCIRLHLDPSPYAVRAGNPADLNEAIRACSSCVQSPVSGTQTSDEAAALRACFTRRATVFACKGIIKTDPFDKAAIAAVARIGHHNIVKRTFFCAAARKANG